jgi:hypothetical protein
MIPVTKIISNVILFGMVIGIILIGIGTLVMYMSIAMKGSM